MGRLRDELAELLGEEGLRALSEARGGRMTYFPKRVSPGHWLERAVGREAAERMVLRFEGCRIYVPLSPPPDARNRRIREWRRQGLSASAIAERSGLSERQVRRILRDLRR